jgi:BlaI family penicillinase repressor
MKTPPRISESEWQVMKTVWKRSSCTAHEVVTALSTRKEWSAATIKTLLNRLLAKGALRFEKVGKSYVYYPVFTEDQLRTTEADSFLHRVFDGALSPMVAHFVRSRRLSRKELDELERIFREGRKEP